MNSSLDKSRRKGTGRKRSIEDGNRTPAIPKRKSLRLQHSMSLRIPLADLDNVSMINCYIDVPPKVFSLTYLDDNATQNPESLNCLEELKEKNWQVFLAGHLYNFKYQPAEMAALGKALTSALTVGFQNSEIIFHSEVVIAEQFSPTDNDHRALKITVTGSKLEKESVLYCGYLMSWCNPVRAASLMLPILLCRGIKKYRTLIHSVLSEQFDLFIQQFQLTQEEFMHLSTYCLVMLHQNDPFMVKFMCKIPTADITLSVSVEHILKLWNNIHQEDSNQVELDEILLFYEALESFYEHTYGIKIGHAHYSKVIVPKCFNLVVNGQVWFKSTRILHVVLKYMNHLAVQRLKVKNHVAGSQLAVSNLTH